MKWYWYPAAALTFILGWVYRLTIQVVWNVLINLFWFIRFTVTWKWPTVYKEVKRINRRVKSIADAMIEYRKFRYEYDGITKDAKGIFKFLNMYPTWTAHPWILVGRGLEGNCMDAVIYGKWLLRKVPNKVRADVQIYIPLKPFSPLRKVHYYMSISKYQQWSNGKISTESKMDLARRYLRNKDAIVVFLQ